MGGCNEFQYVWMEEDVVGWQWKGMRLEDVKWVGKGFAGMGLGGAGWDGRRGDVRGKVMQDAGVDAMGKGCNRMGCDEIEWHGMR